MNCFRTFTQNKQQIIFYSHENGDKRINDFLFHPLDKRDSDKEIMREDDDFSNLIRPEIFSMFPNVKTLIIQSTYYNDSYSFSLFGLLNVTRSLNLDEIII